MNRFMIIPTAALFLAGISCKSNSEKIAAENSTLDISNLDTTVSPQDDFYRYACGGWMDKNPLPGDYSRYGSFDQLAENNVSQLKELIEELSANVEKESGLAKKIGVLYNLAMDMETRDGLGIEPVKPLLQEVEAMQNEEEQLQALAHLHHRGILPFFGFYVDADLENSTKNMMNLYQAGIGMPDRDYYLSQDENSKTIREQYKLHIQKMFSLYGYDENSADFSAKVYKVEEALAQIHLSREELRDTKANFKRISVDELSKLFSQIDWKAYLKELSPNFEIKEINVGRVELMQNYSKLLGDFSFEEIKAYFLWNVINSTASYLSSEIYAQNFEFYGKTLSGQAEMRPEWKRAVGIVEGVMGEGLGEMYVEKYFPAQAKERMLKLVENVRLAMSDRFETNTWMSEETKAKAKEKLDAILVKIGYPDTWRSYDALEIENDNLYSNILRSNVFDIDYMMSKINKDVDRMEWQMTAQTVNAYYNPTTNEICFPAGILQPPFFYKDGDEAINYGAIGVVIAHELTHGFDDQGREFDKDGNLKNWWTEEDAVKFKEKTQVLVEHFNNIVVIDTMHANGEFTLGENIADNGGLNIAYAALQKALEGKSREEIDGFTQEQRFFLAYANVWAGNIRDEEIRRRTLTDPHSLGRWRVNGTLPHIEEFLQAFGIEEGSAMYLPKEKRAVIW